MPLTWTEQRSPGGKRYLRTVTSGKVTDEDARVLLPLVDPTKGEQVAGFLSVVEPHTDMDPEARKTFGAMGTSSETRIPVAVVVPSAPMRVLLSFVIRMAGTMNMTKFFGTEDEARAWLLAQLDGAHS